MKKINHNFAAAFIAAVLFSCGGSNEKTTPADSLAENHEHHSDTAKQADTAVIKEGQEVYFDKDLKNGDVVKIPLTVHFGVKGMKVTPLDSGVLADCGHHHLLIDTLGFVPAGTMVPMGSKKVVHFGKGQLESKPLELKPGKHTLTLQFANGNHISYGVRMSKTIEITVK